jgi:hypothetical protein
LGSAPAAKRRRAKEKKREKKATKQERLQLEILRAEWSHSRAFIPTFFLSFLFFSFLLLHLMGHGEPKRHPVQRNLGWLQILF